MYNIYVSGVQHVVHRFLELYSIYNDYKILTIFPIFYMLL